MDQHEEHPAPVLQAHPVAVAIEGVVHTAQRYSRSGGYRTITLSTTSATRILDHDPKRKRATLIVADKAGQSRGAALGSTQAEAAENIGANIPLYGTSISTAYVHPPVVIESIEELWAIGCGTSCTVTVINEQWCD